MTTRLGEDIRNELRDCGRQRGLTFEVRLPILHESRLIGRPIPFRPETSEVGIGSVVRVELLHEIAAGEIENRVPEI